MRARDDAWDERDTLQYRVGELEHENANLREQFHAQHHGVPPYGAQEQQGGPDLATNFAQAIDLDGDE